MPTENEQPKYAIEFVDSATSDDAMYDGYNILHIDGKTAISIATCWDPVVADRILAGFEMLDMLDSGFIPGYPSKRLEIKKPTKPRARSSNK